MSCQHSFRFIALLLCVAALAAPAMAAQVDSNDVYCFSGSDFSTAEEPLAGICITGLPDTRSGSILLGDRVIKSGDVLTAEQLAAMVFSPAPTQQDTSASIQYLPVYSDRVEQEASMVISIHGKEDKAPIAEDSAMETYKNLPNEGTLKVSDPEEQQLTYTLVRPPKRGEVILREDGSFLYTPKHNKVGTDSFAYTAADPAGNVSRQATVTVQILKPTDSSVYSDTADLDCRFTAEWLKNTGIFAGETFSGTTCFGPEEEVSRGQFLTMLMQVLELPVDHSVAYSVFADDAEPWLKPYLAAALRCGIISGYPSDTGAVFCPGQVITTDEAAVMISNALDLSVPTGYSSDQDSVYPVWAANAAAAVSSEGLELPESGTPLTRADVSQILYAVSKISR